jgi:hypothetical protein
MRSWAFLGAAVCWILLAGCTTGDPPVPGPTGPAGPRLLVAQQKTDSTQDAAISGLLGVDAKGCVTVGDLTLVAPAGSQLIDGRTIRLAEIGDYALGDDLPVVSGGLRPADSVEPYLQGCEAPTLAYVMGR